MEEGRNDLNFLLSYLFANHPDFFFECQNVNELKLFYFID